MNDTGEKKSFSNYLWVIFLCAAWFVIGWVVNDRWGPSETDLMDAAYVTILNESIFNEQSKEELSYSAIRGMLSNTNDPFAELIEPEAAQGLVDAFAGQTGVVGLYAENLGGQVEILVVYHGGAAEEAGIKPGDVILSIDGEVLDPDADSSETGLLIRGAPNTPVALEILRGDEVLDFTLIRKQREFVITEMLANEIVYLSLNAFNVTASEVLKQELEALLAQNPAGLILDLRNNEGGDMQACQQMLSYFIEDGLLFSAEQTRGRRVEFPATGGAIAAEIPIVVLMDETTYSAAETAAAAIAQLGRGTTVGSRSFGKGLIQATLPLVDDAMLQITVAKWFSANGEWYQETGLQPQIEVFDDPGTEADELVLKAVEILQAQP